MLRVNAAHPRDGISALGGKDVADLVTNENGLNVVSSISAFAKAPATQRNGHPDLLDDIPGVERDILDKAKKQSQVVMDSDALVALSRAELLILAGIPIVIEGETGAGKTLFAHVASNAVLPAIDAFLAVDCSVAEFNATTVSAMARYFLDRRGLLVLDHIDELSACSQSMLSCLLETLYERNGETFSLISITSTTFLNSEEQENFRTDLTHRIKGATLALEPLRCAGDLAGLMQSFLNKMTDCPERFNLSKESLAILTNYHWPGNRRELSNALKHSMALSKGGTILPSHLPAYIVNQLSHRDLSARSQSQMSRIEAALRFNGGNVSKTAKYLGISRATLYRKIQIDKARVHN